MTSNNQHIDQTENESDNIYMETDNPHIYPLEGIAVLDEHGNNITEAQIERLKEFKKEDIIFASINLDRSLEVHAHSRLKSTNFKVLNYGRRGGFKKVDYYQHYDFSTLTPVKN